MWEEHESSPDLTFHFPEALYSWRACNTSRAAFERSSAGGMRCGGGPNQHICNELYPMGFVPCCPRVVDAMGASSPAFVSHYFLVLFLSMGVCTGQHLLLSVVFRQTSSAFALSWQIRLGSYEMPPKGHRPSQVLPALCPSPQDTVRCCGCGWPSSCSNEDWALVSCWSFFLLSYALTLLPAKSFRMWISWACICLFGCPRSAARLKWRHQAWSEGTARTRSSQG